MPILQVEGLVKIYGRRRVVDGVDFEVNAGEIVGLLGPERRRQDDQLPHGLRHGRARRRQSHAQRHRRHQLADVSPARDGGMGYLPQDQSVFRKLSVEQNLLAVMEMLGMGHAERRQKCEELMARFGITHIRKSTAMLISGGEKRRLELARSLVSNPKIILLDEPFTGIDPVTINEIQKIIRGLRENGIAILITDHRERETLAITDRSYVIRAGMVLCHGSADEVLNHPEARKYYFGEGPDLNVA